MSSVRIEIYDQSGRLLVNQDTLLLKEVATLTVSGPGSINLAAQVPANNSIIAVPDRSTTGGDPAYQPRLSQSDKTVYWNKGDRSGLNLRLTFQTF